VHVKIFCSFIARFKYIIIGLWVIFLAVAGILG
jgi:hypothetical protein